MSFLDNVANIIESDSFASNWSNTRKQLWAQGWDKYLINHPEKTDRYHTAISLRVKRLKLDNDG